MKYLKSTFAIIISLAASTVYACGPAFFEIPKPNYLRLTNNVADVDTRAENIRLWQQQTSPDIKAEDIEAVIYGDESPAVWGPYNLDTEDQTLMTWEYDNRQNLGSNTFLNYLYNSADDEAFQFVMMAKHIAKLRSDRNSPWYYPASPFEVSNGFEPAIRTIMAYQGDRFYNRYSLQLIRALFASARYEECIAAFNERFAHVDDTDLMKRMSCDYVAGAALRIGESQTAIDYFTSTGDVESLLRFTTIENPFEVAALSNPDSPKLLNYIASHFNGPGNFCANSADSAVVKDVIIPTARKVVNLKQVENRAMWYYILAVGEGEFNNDYTAAYRCIKKAHKYPAGRFADDIHCYQIVTEAALGKQDSLIANLNWLETKIADFTSKDKNHWEQAIQNIILTRIAPWYAKHGESITALQLANYADNMPLRYSTKSWRYSTVYGNWQTRDVITARTDSAAWNGHDYSNTFFEYMTLQAPETIERYIASLSSTSPLASYLNSRGYTSLDYLYDILGTMYLARRDYANAVRSLSHISDGYQKVLNVDRGGFLRRDPFTYMSEYQTKDRYDNGFSYTSGGPIANDFIINHKKLYFAGEMLRLEKEMRSASDPNQRAMAKIKYAIGLKNSFNTCWALTSYSRGGCMVAEDNELTEWQEKYLEWPYKSPYHDNDNIKKAIADAEAMLAQALNEITDDEVAARANYMLYNTLTIARHYPNTQIGKMMAKQCDSWSDWIKAPTAPKKTPSKTQKTTS